eukprot:GHVO01008196.1.p1 GENE.GHVO01008196.1~~GHVO01008196.1.p1  ORF type:complete len:141 (+),score=5.18 GHVO01008196.1:27-449(+)
MSLQSGNTYTIVNAKSRTAIDLSGGDGKSIIGFDYHGQGNQQWRFEQRGDARWVIRSVSSGKSLDFEGEAHDGAPVIATSSEREWDIWPEQSVQDGFRIFVPGTKQNIDLSDHGNPAPGTPVTLWYTWEGLNQVWLVRRA